MGTGQQPQLPETIYATLTGTVDAQMVQRVFNAGSIAVNGGVKTLHLLIHSTGGFIGDGIGIYNYLRNLPIALTTYNVGSISSIAVHVYLSGKIRKVSKTATFMLHKSTYTPTVATAERLKMSAEGLLIEDQRSESILRENVKLPPEKWQVHERGDLTLTAEESVQFGLAHAIGDWAPPAGARISTI